MLGWALERGRVQGRDTQRNKLFLMLGCICQEIRTDPQGCTRYGAMIGEKVSEEVAEMGAVTGEEPINRFIEVFATEILPIYFMCAPEVKESLERKETVLKIEELPILKYCREKDICDIFIGVLYSFSERIGKGALRIKPAQNYLSFSVSWGG